MRTGPDRGVWNDHVTIVQSAINEPSRQGHGVVSNLGEVGGGWFCGEFDVDDAEFDPRIIISQPQDHTGRGDISIEIRGGR